VDVREREVALVAQRDDDGTLVHQLLDHLPQHHLACVYPLPRPPPIVLLHQKFTARYRRPLLRHWVPAVAVSPFGAWAQQLVRELVHLTSQPRMRIIRLSILENILDQAVLHQVCL
jgi:hypothetical protein